MIRVLGAFFVDIIETVVIAIFIFVVVYMFLLQPHQVRGESMLPTFENSQYILTDKLSYRFSPPQRGDVVVFKSPQDGSFDYIKRIIGLSGEKVKLSAGKVIIINSDYSGGQTLNESYTNGAPTAPGVKLGEGEEYLIPPDHFFVLGDNRSQSTDSRVFGAIKKESIIGRAWVRYWPLPKLSFVQQVQY